MAFGNIYMHVYILQCGMIHMALGYTLQLGIIHTHIWLLITMSYEGKPHLHNFTGYIIQGMAYTYSYWQYDIHVAICYSIFHVLCIVKYKMTPNNSYSGICFIILC